MVAAVALTVGVASVVLTRDDDPSGITVARPDATSTTTTATPPCDGTRTDVEAAQLPELHDARSDRTFTGQPGPDELPPAVVDAWSKIVAAATRDHESVALGARCERLAARRLGVGGLPARRGARVRDLADRDRRRDRGVAVPRHLVRLTPATTHVH